MKLLVGDVVELQPVNTKFRQLRWHHGFVEWEVVGVLEWDVSEHCSKRYNIKALGSSTFAWVNSDEITLVRFRGNRRHLL